MISTSERRSRARELGVQEGAVERDFVLACLLAAHEAEPGPFIFRGGTALAKAYWPDYRLSEDLDFITAGPVPDLQDRLKRLVDRASVEAGLPLQIGFQPPRRGWSRSIVSWLGGEVIIDVNLDEEPSLAAASTSLTLGYQQFQGRVISIPTCVLPEILGNKWYILDDRNEPRDLFDVWWGLCREGIDFAELAAGHQAKFRFLPVRQMLSKAPKLMKPTWDARLANQVRSLPEFDLVEREVLVKYDTWEAEGKPVSRLSD